MDLINLAVVVVISFIYVWTLYSVPVLVTGIRNLYKTKDKKKNAVLGTVNVLPKISMIVPVKNEAKVVGRFLSSILGTDYPVEKREIVVVEDGSSDDTSSICYDVVQKFPGQVKVVCREVSDGKPSALVEALKHCTGDIVGVFDADNVVEKDALLRVAEHFNNSSVVAIQGKVSAINAEENMLTQLVANEENLRYDGYCRGKDVLGLFVPLMGTNYFVRRKDLESVGGWDPSMLSEDMELAARLVYNGKKVKYAPDVRSWQEYPGSIMGFFKQRIRWWRGSMEVGLKYGKLLRNPNKLTLDAELSLAGSFVFICYLLGYVVALLSVFVPYTPDFITSLLANVTSAFTFALLGLAGGVMVYATKPRTLKNTLYLPLLYLYWVALNFVASYALLQMIFRRPRRWIKTHKNGTIACSKFTVENINNLCELKVTN